MTVWDVPCVANSLWVNQQRIRQYTGGHDETWGEITFNIDANVAAGPVADPARGKTLFRHGGGGRANVDAG